MRYNAYNGINRIFFLKDYLGFTACNDGIVCKVGSYFSRYNLPGNPPVCINDVEFLNAAYGVAVGDNKKVFLSMSGGSSWR